MNTLLESINNILELEYDRAIAYENRRRYWSGSIFSCSGELVLGENKCLQNMTSLNISSGDLEDYGDTFIIPMFKDNVGALVVLEVSIDHEECSKMYYERTKHELLINNRYAILLDKNYMSLSKYYHDGEEYKEEKISAAKASSLLKKPKLLLTDYNSGSYMRNFYEIFLQTNNEFQAIRRGSPIIYLGDFEYTGPRVKREFLKLARSKKFNDKKQEILNTYEIFQNIKNYAYTKPKLARPGIGDKSYNFYSLGESNENGILILYYDKEKIRFRREDSNEILAYLGIHIAIDGTVTEFKILNDCSVINQKFSKYVSVVASNHANANDVSSSSIMKWKNEIIKDVGLNLQDGYMILELAVNPLLETLYKIGFKDLVIDQLKQSFDVEKSAAKVDKSIESYFGKVNNKEKKVNNILGLNKSQLNLFKEEYDRGLYTPHMFKYILSDGEGINDISEREFNLVKDIYEGYDNSPLNNIQAYRIEKSFYLTELLKVVYEVHGVQGLEFAKEFLENSYYSDFMIEHLSSYYNLYQKLRSELAEGYKISINSIDDLDARIAELTYLYRFVEQEEERKKFSKSVDKYRKLENDGEKYCIVAPNTPVDLINEGGELGHCVASYVSSVSSGKSRILFVRDVEDKDKPLYTLEVDSRNKVVQFRGRANSTPPRDAFNYVEKSLKKHL